jgi:2-polyprenyl-3-methyl-5-hydroxy-6-metoxy-1,4-benzoquinol methylase
MSTNLWPELYSNSNVLTGNVAKVKVLQELHRLTSNGSTVSVLDIGCIGLRPLEFWEPLLDDPGAHFRLTGVDVKDVEPARKIVAQRGWADQVVLQQGSGYELENMFAPQSYDVVTANQVLEHIARLPLFMKQVAAVLRSNGEAFFTVDSAHWRSRFDLREPIRLFKNIVKKGLSLIKYERHYDLPWEDAEVEAACQEGGLKLVECGYYNLAPLKFIHNHIIPPRQKNAFIRLWSELEEFLNSDEAVKKKTKTFSLGLYLHVRKC